MKIRNFTLAALVVVFAMPAIAQNAVVQQGDPHGGNRSEKSDNSLKGPLFPKGKGWYEDGMAAIRAKNPSRAVELMKPLLADFEKRYAGEKRHIYCAVTSAQTKAYLADAAKAALEAVTIEPDWCRAQYVRGYALIDLGQIDEALAAFQHLTDLAPRNSRYLNELGYVFSDKKNYKEAVAAYQRSVAAADLSPDSANYERCIAYRGIGYNLTKLGRLNDAEAAYRSCLKIDPDNQEVKDAIESLNNDRKETV